MKTNRIKWLIICLLAVWACFWTPLYFWKALSYEDAYFYVPANIRAAPHYTDVKMFECEWCHRVKNLNRHHIIPQSANPALKDDYDNIIVLCRDCHFVLGHRCNWKKFNPDVRIIVNTYTNTITSKDYLARVENAKF